MKFRTKLKLVAVNILAMSAAAASAGPGFTSAFQIAKIFPREYCIDLVTVAPITNPMGCSRTDAVRLEMTAGNYSAIASVLTTAFATGKTVTVWVDSCGTDGVAKMIAASVER